MTLGERLLTYRTNAKLSQDALAEKIGVTRQTISKWETNQSTPEFNKILPLCELFGITTDELIKGEKSTRETKTVTYAYEERRNKKKAMVISISIFLYCIGLFSPIYMVEALQYEESHAIMIMFTLWTIASVMLVYFFMANPKVKDEKKKEDSPNIENTVNKMENRKKNASIILESNFKIEIRIMVMVALVFLLLYVVVSFATMSWHITWILWIVLAIVEIVIKLIFDMIRRKE